VLPCIFDSDMTSIIYRKRLVVCPLQQLLRKYATVLPYTYIAYLGMFYCMYVCNLNILLLFNK